MSEEFRFFNYLLEKYSKYKNKDAGMILSEWDKAGITQEVFDGYFQYHQERIENAYDDIDSLMATGKHIDYGYDI